jgi:hypothetical protein
MILGYDESGSKKAHAILSHYPWIKSRSQVSLMKE